MNVVDDTKLETAANGVVDHAAVAASAILDSLDGWTLTVHIPPIVILRWTLTIPDITVRLSKPTGKEAK